MAEPLKSTPPLDDSSPRSARARSERDIGSRSKRPARVQRSSAKSKPSETRSEPRPKSPRAEASGDAPPRSGAKGTRPTRSGGRSPQRPRDVKAGNGARLLAPLALVVFAIACFTVLSSQDDGKGARSSSDEPTAAKAAAATAAAKSGPTRSTYKVKPGDSFAAIAEKQGVDVETLQELNPDIDPRALQPGQKLKLK